MCYEIAVHNSVFSTYDEEQNEITTNFNMGVCGKFYTQVNFWQFSFSEKFMYIIVYY